MKKITTSPNGEITFEEYAAFMGNSWCFTAGDRATLTAGALVFFFDNFPQRITTVILETT